MTNMTPELTNAYDALAYCQKDRGDIAAERDRLKASNARLCIALRDIIEWMEQVHPEAAKNIPNARAAIAQAALANLNRPLGDGVDEAKTLVKGGEPFAAKAKG